MHSDLKQKLLAIVLITGTLHFFFVAYIYMWTVETGEGLDAIIQPSLPYASHMSNGLS